jgi:hypothetical protein
MHKFDENVQGDISLCSGEDSSLICPCRDKCIRYKYYDEATSNEKYFKIPYDVEARSCSEYMPDIVQVIE